MIGNKVDSNRRSAVVFQGRFPEKILTNAGARRAYNLARGLVAAGVDATFVSPDHFGTNEERAGLPAIRLGTPLPRPTVRSRRGFWKALEGYAVRENCGSVLFYNTTIDSIFTMRRLRRKGITVAYEMCDLVSTLCNGVMRKQFNKFAETLLPRQSSLNLTISSGIEHHFRRVAPKVPAFIIPGLFDCDQFRVDLDAAEKFRIKYSIASDVPLFAYCGSWARVKGLEIMLRAWARVMVEDPTARLVVTGCWTATQDSFDARLFADELGIAEQIVFPGYLDDAGLTALLSAADVVLCPHNQHPFSDYAFPTKIAEYAGMGRAIISTDVGDVSRYLRDGFDALICAPDSIDSLTAAMLRLALSPALRLTLGKNASAAARKYFDYRENGELLFQLLEQSTVLSATGRGPVF